MWKLICEGSESFLLSIMSRYAASRAIFIIPQLNLKIRCAIFVRESHEIILYDLSLWLAVSTRSFGNGL